MIRKANEKKKKKESKAKGNFSGASLSVWLQHRMPKGYVKWVPRVARRSPGLE